MPPKKHSKDLTLILNLWSVFLDTLYILFYSQFAPASAPSIIEQNRISILNKISDVRSHHACIELPASITLMIEDLNYQNIQMLLEPPHQLGHYVWVFLRQICCFIRIFMKIKQENCLLIKHVNS